MNIHTFVVLAYKESKYLEDCIKSVKNQSIKTNIVIATSTPNDYISKIAKKYNLDIIINKEKKGIGYDFDFAINCVNSKLVTVAHQDDIYDYDYAKNMIDAYLLQKKSLIIFSDYYEIRNESRVYKNLNLNIKRILLKPLLNHRNANNIFIKRKVIKFGSAICCPAVTFVKKNIPKEVFGCDLKCDVDWYAWEKLSKLEGYFYYINNPLMGHRISVESTTTEIINENGRTKEDYLMFCKFWPKWVSRILSKIYSYSEKSNSNK